MTGWHTSRRRDSLPPDWKQRRAKARTRAGGICEHRDKHGTRCTRQGRDCDHIRDRNNHDLSNLQWLCTDHHKQKTQREARAAQHAKYTAAKKRTPEAHPGIRTPTTTLGGPPFGLTGSRRA